MLALTQLVIQVVTNSVGSTKAAEGALVYVGLLLMAAQLPVIAFFAIRWLRRTPWQAVTVLVVQAIAFAAAAVLPVFEFRW